MLTMIPETDQGRTEEEGVESSTVTSGRQVGHPDHVQQNERKIRYSFFEQPLI